MALGWSGFGGLQMTTAQGSLAPHIRGVGSEIPAGTGLYWQILDICAHAGFRPRVAREVLEPSTIIGRVAAGVGVAIVPDGIQCIRLNGAIYKPLTDISAYSALYLARRQDDPNTHLRAIRELLATTGVPQQRQKKRATAHSRK
jgi:DNA-binding transcriptional LysR family regulator